MAEKAWKSFRKDLPALKFDQNYFYLEIEKEKVDISKVKARFKLDWKITFDSL